jgi:hypothetical protein
MKIILNKLIAFLLLILVVACVDESKDPIKFAKVTKGTYLALRGDAQDNLDNTGCTNSFYRDKILGTEVFSFDADYLSIDQESLKEVQVFAAIPEKKGLYPRTLVTTVPGSAFKFVDGSTTKRGNISITLDEILTALKIKGKKSPLDTMATQALKISCDLLLVNGTKIEASSIINPNLFESVIFNPAMNLSYCANKQANFVPVAETSLLGEWSVDAKTKKVVHTLLPPLKDGKKDTLYIKYDNDIVTPPTVTFDPPSAGTGTTLVSAKKVDKNGFYTKDIDKSAFYLIYTANGSYSGPVTATIEGATAKVGGVELTQDPNDQIINVDNTTPQITSDIGDFRIGKGQFITLSVSYNEKMSRKSADAVKATISGQGLETITNAPMKISADGLSATLIYIYKLADPLVPATHGDLLVSFSGGKDEAGNAAPTPMGTITVDVKTPPAPTLSLAADYNQGIQIKWTAKEVRSNVDNPNGDQTGKVYFIAIESGKPRPTAVSFDLDGIATWTMQDDPASTADPKEKVSINQSGIVNITNSNGNSANPTYTSFSAKGTLDVYAVFLGNTGNASIITATPQLTVTMN